MKLIASSCEIKAMCLGTWLTIYQAKMLIECYVQRPCTEVENGHYPTLLILFCNRSCGVMDNVRCLFGDGGWKNHSTETLYVSHVGLMYNGNGFLSFISQLRWPIELNFSQVCYFVHNMLRNTKWEDWSLTITNSVSVFKERCLYLFYHKSIYQTNEWVLGPTSFEKKTTLI